jgi:hypothetical protein
MTVNIPSNVAEIKLDMITRWHSIRACVRSRAYLKTSEPSEQQPESKLTRWLTATASATARTAVFTVGVAIGAAVTKLYLPT